MNGRMGSAFVTPPVVKNLLIVNGLFFLAQMVLPHGLGEAMVTHLGLYYWGSEHFRLYQVVTHMFLHGSFTHLLFNMFALWMFGRTLEYDLGGKRFLTYYFVTGIGAAILQMCVSGIEIAHLRNALGETAMSFHGQALLQAHLNGVTIGASGAVFGVLLSFGMMHPNTIIMLLFPPIPIKAKWFVILYGLLELYLGFSGNQPGVAHFAHVGGMLFGYLLLRYWKQSGKIYY